MSRADAVAAAALLLAVTELALVGWTTALAVAQIVASVTDSALAVTSAVRHYRRYGACGTRSDRPS